MYQLSYLTLFNLTFCQLTLIDIFLLYFPANFGSEEIPQMCVWVLNRKENDLISVLKDTIKSLVHRLYNIIIKFKNLNFPRKLSVNIPNFVYLNWDLTSRMKILYCRTKSTRFKYYFI